MCVYMCVVVEQVCMGCGGLRVCVCEMWVGVSHRLIVQSLGTGTWGLTILFSPLLYV